MQSMKFGTIKHNYRNSIWLLLTHHIKPPMDPLYAVHALHPGAFSFSKCKNEDTNLQVTETSTIHQDQVTHAASPTPLQVHPH